MVAVAVGAALTWVQPIYYGPLISAMAAFFACAAGNIVNDICDLPIDRINRPGRVLVRGTVSIGLAWKLAVACSLMAILLAVAVNRAVTASVVVALSLLAAYNFRLKRKVLIGNVVIAVLSGMAFMTGGWAVSPRLSLALPGPLVPAMFAFLFHLVREILKDVQDIEGDRAGGVRTLPQVWGVSRSLLLALGLFLLLTLLTYIPVLAGWFGRSYEIIVVYVVDLPLLALLILIWGNPSRRMLTAGSIGLKLGMLLGLIALLSG
jgi:geranylgeranylglycerol-phosphate geranylgeranyltransferase